MSLELLNYGNQGISLILLFFLDYLFSLSQNDYFSFVFWSSSKNYRGWEGKEEGEEEEYKLVDYWIAIGV